MEQKRKFDRRNKGGRPKKGAADKLKYRPDFINAPPKLRLAVS